MKTHTAICCIETYTNKALNHHEPVNPGYPSGTMFGFFLVFVTFTNWPSGYMLCWIELYYVCVCNHFCRTCYKNNKSV